MSFFEELKRRNVLRVGVAYAIAAWLLLQISDLVLNNIAAPAWVIQVIMLLLAIGFPLVVMFAWVFEMTPEGLKREKEVDRSQSIVSQTGRKLDRMIIGVLTITVAYLLIDKLVLTDSKDDKGSGSFSQQSTALESDAGNEKMNLTPAVPATAKGASVAVLPFVNMSGDANNEYFSDGLTETLLHMLAQLPDLRVAARTSSFAFKGKDTGIAEISKTLGVEHVLEGSVQKAGNRVRITAQLIRGNDGFHVWSQNYDRTLEDIFAIQDEIATDVANALDASLLGGNNAIHNVDTTNLSAYDTYLKALEQQAIFSFGSLPQAQSLLKEALAADPEFVDAKLALARNYQMMAWTGIIGEEESRQQALPLIQQVLETDPANYLARALKLNSELGLNDQFKPEERARKYQELRDLLPLLPNSTSLREAVAGFLAANQARYQESAEVLEAGLLIDPLAANLHDGLGKTLTMMGHYDKAMASLQRALTLQPDSPNIYFDIADLHAEMGDLNGSLEWRRKAVEVDPQDHELAAELAQFFFDLGLLEEGNHWAAKSIALAPQSAVGRKVRMLQAYALGDMEQALALAQSMITDQVSMRQGSFFTALAMYNKIMSERGREREAYDFLLSVRPELEDFATFPGNYRGEMMQRHMILLMSAFKSPEETRKAWLDFASVMDRAFPRWREIAINQFLDELMQGSPDEAERMAIDAYLSEPVSSNLRAVENLQEPVFGVINQRPELLARMSVVQKEKAKLRDGVSEMLLKPEWQK
jgi:TolB-like protein/Tfp pilus assembly protein PilF